MLHENIKLWRVGYKLENPHLDLILKHMNNHLQIWNKTSNASCMEKLPYVHFDVYIQSKLGTSVLKNLLAFILSISGLVGSYYNG